MSTDEFAAGNRGPATAGTSETRVDTISNQVRAGVLDLVWSDGKRQRFTHAFLRNQCQCTKCKFNRLQGKTANILPIQLRITEIHPVGAYGMQLVFSDGHDRGIYPWTYLRELTQEHQE